MKKWITFDLDGTLMENPFSKWVFPEIEKLVLEASPEEYKVVRQLVDEHKRRLTLSNYVGAYDWDDILNIFLKERHIRLDINVEELVLKFSVYPKVYLLEENMLYSLQELKQSGFSLAAVTNGFYKYQFPVMKTLGLNELFDDIITPSESGYGKPDARMAEKLSANGEIIAHIGDRVDHDVYFSNQLKVSSILIDKKMPEDIKNATIMERNAHTDYMESLMEKYQMDDGVVDQQYVPEAIIHSIDELPDLFGK